MENNSNFVGPTSSVTPEEIANWNQVLFRDFVCTARNCGDAGRFEEGLQWASVAARFASRKGWFGELCSPELEAELLHAARSLPTPERGSRQTSRPRWLHVFTEAYATLGHTNLCRRWIQYDKQTIHDVALVDQMGAAPGNLVEAVKKAGGICLILDPMTPLLERAKELRNYAWQNVDVVVLHIHPEDVIATTAFGVAGGPPVLLVNHADHAFWVGCAVADLVLDIRTSGHLWTKKARGVGRATILPLPLLTSQEETDGKEFDPQRKRKIRRELGLPEDGIILLTVGSAAKYEPIPGHDFLLTAVEILRQCRDAHLIAVGPADEGLWKAARKAAGYRLHPVGRQPDSTLFCKAADLYMEGFPAGSLTALLEAGESGLACVRGPQSCIPPYSSDGFGIDELPQPDSTEAYVRTAVQLAQDAVARAELGRKLQSAIRSHYCGVGWLAHLQEMKNQIPGQHAVYPEFSPTAVEIHRRDWFIEYLHRNDHALNMKTVAGEAFVEAWRRTSGRPQIDAGLLEKLKAIERHKIHSNGRWTKLMDQVALRQLNARIRHQGTRLRLIDCANLAISTGRHSLARKLAYRLLFSQLTCLWSRDWLKLLAKVHGGYQLRAWLRRIVPIRKF